MPAEPWPVIARQHARLIKPFPTRRLPEVLYHVSTESSSIDNAVIRLQINPPTDPGEWRFELDALDTALRSLSARCGDALPALEEMARTADADFSRAVSAMLAVIRGIGEDEAPIEAAA